MDKDGYGVVTIEWDTIQKKILPTKLRVRGALVGETVQFRVVSVYADRSKGSSDHIVSAVIFGRKEYLIRPRLDGQPWRSTVNDPSLLPIGHSESPYLVEATCPHFDRRDDAASCSGCNVPHMHYSRQLIEKSRLLNASLSGAIVDPQIRVEPKKTLGFTNRFEFFPFSIRPLGEPVWGQSSFQPTLPGERANAHMVETLGCTKVSKSVRAILTRMSALVSVEQNLLVYEPRINQGVLKSVVFNSVKTKAGKEEVLLTFYTQNGQKDEFLKKIAERLVEEFSTVLMGVCAGKSLLVGTSHVSQYIESIDCELLVNAESASVETHIAEIFLPEIITHTNKIFVFGEIGQIAPQVAGIETHNGQQVWLEAMQNGPILKAEITGVQTTNAVVHQNDMKVDKTHQTTAVIAYPPNPTRKADIKGVTSKEFRHWLGGVFRPDRIVIITNEWDGLRKDIGHLKLMGYETTKVEAVDSEPGNMKGISVLTIMEKKKSYEPLKPEQIT